MLAAGDDPGPVQQFVTERAGRVEVGFRWPDDGTVGHLAYFDLMAFKNPAKRCVYCGYRATPASIAAKLPVCRAHNDLPKLDPYFDPERRRR